MLSSLKFYKKSGSPFYGGGGGRGWGRPNEHKIVPLW